MYGEVRAPILIGVRVSRGIREKEHASTTSHQQKLKIKSW
jgi:hypothetical protein